MTLITRCALSIAVLGVLLTGCTSGTGTHMRSARAATCVDRTSPPLCYSAREVRTAYGVQPLLQRGITGKGTTIVIVAVDGIPRKEPLLKADVRESLRAYDRQFHLSDPTLTFVSPFRTGLTVEAAAEVILDIESAHLIAPGAALSVIIPNTDRNRSSTTSQVTHMASALAARELAAVNYAVLHNLGDVITMSYGVSEACLDVLLRRELERVFNRARQAKITLVAASGDTGVLNQTFAGRLCTSPATALRPTVILPAASPLVLAVGGTALHVTDPTGAYGWETTWNERIASTRAGRGGFLVVSEASGGGNSTVFARPAYQAGIRTIHAQRAIPDVAFNADSRFAVPGILVTRRHRIVLPAGGTSVGAPAWAGLVALADQYAGRRLGFVNPALYRIARSTRYAHAFHDIVTGINTVTVETPRNRFVSVEGFGARPGWDAATGWGTPNAAILVPLLARYLTR